MPLSIRGKRFKGVSTRHENPLQTNRSISVPVPLNLSPTGSKERFQKKNLKGTLDSSVHNWQRLLRFLIDNPLSDVKFGGR